MTLNATGGNDDAGLYPERAPGFVLGYYEGWADAKAGRQYGKGIHGRRSGIEENGAWLVPPWARPTCSVSGKPCTSWTCLVDRCVDVGGGDT
jgi:hypothetical protein